MKAKAPIFSTLTGAHMCAAKLDRGDTSPAPPFSTAVNRISVSSAPETRTGVDEVVSQICLQIQYLLCNLFGGVRTVHYKGP